jgi:hypothetical protein
MKAAYTRYDLSLPTRRDSRKAVTKDDCGSLTESHIFPNQYIAIPASRPGSARITAHPEHP